MNLFYSFLLAECEPAVCPGSQESQDVLVVSAELHPAAAGGDHPSVLSPGEATRGVLRSLWAPHYKKDTEDLKHVQTWSCKGSVKGCCVLMKHELTERQTRCISFLQVYEAGVVKALQDLAPEILKSASKIYGISSGSIVAAFAACEMQQYLHSAGKLFFTTLFTARGKVLLVVKEALSKFLPANAHQLASGKLHIILTRLRDWNCVTVSEFASKEDIIQAVLCSCFIPLCFGFIPPLYHGVRYIDGEFGMWKTNLVSQTTITVSALAGEFDICPRDCPVPFFVFQIVDWVLHVSEQNLYRVQCLFQCPSAKVSCFLRYPEPRGPYGWPTSPDCHLPPADAFGIKFLPENFTLSLHKESCQKGEGTLHRKPGTGAPCSRATDSQDITKENTASICSADELEEEDISTSCNPQKDERRQLVWLQEDL
ncbi:uncharacterized protein LOC122168382 isoform X2 [Centrocercus urophasianus]|uniref:uncharacterized protein LOC122168382 isoform X2 n=1 Tax=Centrocercus urophasianus TaxID=9002 RepID=UPI001C64D136|nr:uncharacterized protein LOC122168382 isoform X2 [Centrocercus urophasianus]